MTQPTENRQSRGWLWFAPPLTFGMIGAALYLWGMYGLDNTPPSWPSGIHAGQLPYGEATFAYGAAHLAFAGAVIMGVLCTLGFLTTLRRTTI